MSSPRKSVKKRPASSPNEGINKEMKNAKESQEASPPTSTPLSFAEVTTAGLSLTTTTVTGASGSTFTTTTATRAGSDNGRNPDDKSVFKTSVPEGGYRDEIIVGVDTIDGETYRGTITVREAVREIFLGIMEFSKEALASVSIGFNKGRIVTFKLVDKFDIDQLASIEEFSFNRQGQRKDGSIFEQKIGCKIRGIRKQTSRPMQDYMENQIRWVKIEGCEYRVEKAELETWMNYLGDVITEITEDRINLDDESGSDEENPGFSVGTGIYSVKMKISRDLPQFVPICGKRIRLYYRDIPKVCTQCFGRHPRKGCTAQKVPWVKYVSDFMVKYAYIPKESYGKWGKIVDEWRTTEEGQTRPETDGNQETEGESASVHSNVDTSSTPETGDESDTTGVKSRKTPLLNGGAKGLEASGGPTHQADAAMVQRDPVGLALRKLRTLGIDTSAVKMAKTPEHDEDLPLKTARSSTASRGRKNST